MPYVRCVYCILVLFSHSSPSSYSYILSKMLTRLKFSEFRDTLFNILVIWSSHFQNCLGDQFYTRFFQKLHTNAGFVNHLRRDNFFPHYLCTFISQKIRVACSNKSKKIVPITNSNNCVYFTKSEIQENINNIIENYQKSTTNGGELVIENYVSVFQDGVHTGCPRRNVPDYGRVFLMLKCTDITQKTYPKFGGYGDIGQRSLKL